MHRCVCLTGWLHFSSTVLRQDRARAEWRARWGGARALASQRAPPFYVTPRVCVCSVFRMSSECTSIKSSSQHNRVTAGKMHFHNWSQASRSENINTPTMPWCARSRKMHLRSSHAAFRRKTRCTREERESPGFLSYTTRDEQGSDEQDRKRVIIRLLPVSSRRIASANYGKSQSVRHNIKAFTFTVNAIF
jgi:hypothetical protein